MLKKIKENRKNKNKGFTLVELIVVLVILAILAALLVPALTGYIDKAKEKSIIAETRQVVIAAQTLVDEAYAKKDVGTDITIKSSGGDVAYGDIYTLAEVKGTIEENPTVEDGKVTVLKYKSGGKTCTYKANETDKYTVQ